MLVAVNYCFRFMVPQTILILSKLLPVAKCPKYIAYIAVLIRSPLNSRNSIDKQENTRLELNYCNIAVSCKFAGIARPVSPEKTRPNVH
jgi:hypothetical protein